MARLIDSLVARLLALAFALNACCAHAAGTPQHGFEPPAGIGGPIELIDQKGERFSLARVAGRPALVFFGLIHCGSTCPAALGTARQVLDQFDAGRAPSVVFVTLDPLNDSPDVLRKYLGNVDARVIGLTGDPMRVERTAERFGVGLRVQSSGAIDHSAMWYLLDGMGRVRRVYRHTTPAADLVADVLALQTP